MSKGRQRPNRHPSRRDARYFEPLARADRDRLAAQLEEGRDAWDDLKPEYMQAGRRIRPLDYSTPYAELIAKWGANVAQHSHRSCRKSRPKWLVDPSTLAHDPGVMYWCRICAIGTWRKSGTPPRRCDDCKRNRHDSVVVRALRPGLLRRACGLTVR